jgi:hypothetical protein
MMATEDLDGRIPSGNPPTSFTDFILQFAEAGLAVELRPDIGAIELAVRSDGEAKWVVVLGPAQAVAVAQRLISAALAIAASEGGS